MPEGMDPLDLWSRYDEQRKVLERTQRKLDKLHRSREELEQAVYQAVRDGVATLDIKPVKAPAKDRRKKMPEVATILLSDWQLGKKTPDYNSEVCEQRIEMLAPKIIELTEIQRQDHPVKELHIHLLGDLVEGEQIFPGQAWRIDSSLFRQVSVDGPRILVNFIRQMQAQFEHIHIESVIGNHGAIGGRARREYHPESNSDSMLYTNVRNILEAAGKENITWGEMFSPDERDWFAIDEIGSHRFLLIHGDQVRGYNGIPWYGWDRKVPKWFMAFQMDEKKSFNYITHGHFHTPVRNFINGVKVWGNGATESFNTYALEQLAAAGSPCQQLLFVHPERGVTAEYLVDLV
jgi:hypothetical protein